jgi:acylphosphatase
VGIGGASALEQGDAESVVRLGGARVGVEAVAVVFFRAFDGGALARAEEGGAELEAEFLRGRLDLEAGGKVVGGLRGRAAFEQETAEVVMRDGEVAVEGEGAFVVGVGLGGHGGLMVREAEVKPRTGVAGHEFGGFVQAFEGLLELPGARELFAFKKRAGAGGCAARDDQQQQGAEGGGDGGTVFGGHGVGLVTLAPRSVKKRTCFGVIPGRNFAFCRAAEARALLYAPFPRCPLAARRGFIRAHDVHSAPLPFLRMNRQRVSVHYSGRVQGVGFRYTVKTVVTGFDVMGTVRNLPDGRVELIAEGDRTELEAFLEAIRDSGLGSHIRDESVSWIGATGGLRGFHILP